MKIYDTIFSKMYPEKQEVVVANGESLEQSGKGFTNEAETEE